jgi:hypothetical protein
MPCTSTNQAAAPASFTQQGLGVEEALALMQQAVRSGEMQQVRWHLWSLRRLLLWWWWCTCGCRLGMRVEGL